MLNANHAGLLSGTLVCGLMLSTSAGLSAHPQANVGTRTVVSNSPEVNPTRAQEPAPSSYERVRDVPDAIASALQAGREAGVASFKSPISVLGQAGAKGLSNISSAAELGQTSYDCGAAAQRGGLTGLEDCGGEVANLGTSFGVGAIGEAGPIGAAAAAGFALGKVIQQALSAVTGEPTLQDQATDWWADRFYGSTSDLVQAADDAYRAKSGYSIDEIQAQVSSATPRGDVGLDAAIDAAVQSADTTAATAELSLSGAVDGGNEQLSSALESYRSESNAIRAQADTDALERVSSTFGAVSWPIRSSAPVTATNRQTLTASKVSSAPPPPKAPSPKYERPWWCSRNAAC